MRSLAYLTLLLCILNVLTYNRDGAVSYLINMQEPQIINVVKIIYLVHPAPILVGKHVVMNHMVEIVLTLLVNA